MRVLIGMSHELKRYGCIQLLKDIRAIEYMVTAEVTEDFIHSLQQYTFDLIVIDSSLHELKGVQAIISQLDQQPETCKCVFLLNNPSQNVYELFLEKRIEGICYEGASLEELMIFFQRIMEGERVSSNLNKKPVPNTDHWSSSNALTKREEEVFFMKVRGFSLRETAEMLNISEKTVENHRRNIRKKLNINKNSEWIEWGRKMEML